MNRQNCWFFEIWWRNTTASTETFTKKLLGHNSALHITSYLSIALSKILPQWKATKNAKKLSVFGENNCCRLCNFLQTHIFWKFDHISRTYNQINYRNIWFAKVTIIIIMMAQVFFFFLIFFSKKTRTLMPLSKINGNTSYTIFLCWIKWKIQNVIALLTQDKKSPD